MERLSREQWLDHGLQSLADSGFTALKADKLVKTLGVSRGSFYWHFKDLAAFHTAVLERWREVTVNMIIADIEQQEEDAHKKLRRLITIAISSERALEQAIRAWALNHTEVQAAVSTIDQQRLAYVQSLLESIGLASTTAALRARIVYCGYLGQIMLQDSIEEAQQDQLIDELMKIALQDV